MGISKGPAVNSLKTVGMLAAFLVITWLAADERGNLMAGTRYETPFASFFILFVVVPTVGWVISQVVKMGATSNQPSPEQPPLKQTAGEPVNWPAVVLMIAGLAVGVAIGPQVNPTAADCAARNADAIGLCNAAGLDAGTIQISDGKRTGPANLDAAAIRSWLAGA